MLKGKETLKTNRIKGGAKNSNVVSLGGRFFVRKTIHIGKAGERLESVKLTSRHDIDVVYSCVIKRSWMSSVVAGDPEGRGGGGGGEKGMGDTVRHYPADAEGEKHK